MNILITGANGFIGSYLCEKLAKKNTVIGLIHDKNSQNKYNIKMKQSIKWYIMNSNKEIFVGEDIDVIIHTAGRIPGSGVTANDYINDNINLMNNLLKFSVKKKVKKIIYISAMSIYGEINTDIVDETTPIINPSLYGMTKYIAELLLEEKKEEISSIILRMPVVIGSGMKSGLFFENYKKFLKGENVNIYNGESPYNMIHISDVFNLISNVLTINLSGFNLFTVSNRDRMSIRSVTNSVKELIKSDSEIIESKTKNIGFIISNEKAKKVFDLKPKSSEETISIFIEDMIVNNRRVE